MEIPLACQAGAFTAEERAEWVALADRIVRGPDGFRELEDGFAFELGRTPETLADVARYVEYESRCCPFVDFVVTLPAGGRTVILEMTGRHGVKAVLAHELGIGGR